MLICPNKNAFLQFSTSFPSVFLAGTVPPMFPDSYEASKLVRASETMALRATASRNTREPGLILCSQHLLKQSGSNF